MSYIGQKPADKALVASDLDPAVITGQTALGATPADTDEFLISDAGILKRMDYSHIKASSALTKISTTTISNSASATLDVFTSTYRNYRIIGSGFTPATDGAALNVELFQADNTEAPNYYWGGGENKSNGSDSGEFNSLGGDNEGTFQIFKDTDSGGDESQANFDMMVYQPQLAADTTIGVQSVGRANGTRGSVNNYGGFGGSTNIMTKIKFSFASGNIVNGVVTVYGLEN